MHFTRVLKGCFVTNYHFLRWYSSHLLACCPFDVKLNKGVAG